MNTIFKFFPVFFGIVFFIIIAIWAFYIFLGVKLYTEVESNGLKKVIERVWDGPDNK